MEASSAQISEYSAQCGTGGAQPPDIEETTNRATPAPVAIQPLNKFLPDVCRTADILVVAVGHPELVGFALGRNISRKLLLRPQAAMKHSSCFPPPSPESAET